MEIGQLYGRAILPGFDATEFRRGMAEELDHRLGLKIDLELYLALPWRDADPAVCGITLACENLDFVVAGRQWELKLWGGETAFQRAEAKISELEGQSRDPVQMPVFLAETHAGY
jgi:hypothetical protein